MPDKIPATVEILTLNNAATLRQALESVKAFADILILDGGSTDETLAIAASYGARVLPQFDTKEPNQRISDFAKVRNRGLFAAQYPWFLFLDSDEYFTTDLVEEVERIIKSQNPAAWVWYVPRKYVLKGRIIDCAMTYPTLQTRFFHRGHVECFEKAVHERIIPKKGESIRELKNYMCVPLPDISLQKEKWRHYLKIENDRMDADTRLDILRKTKNTVKVTILYSLRFFRSLLFCSGNRMPFGYEWARQKYNLQLVGLLLKHLL